MMSFFRKQVSLNLLLNTVIGTFQLFEICSPYTGTFSIKVEYTELSTSAIILRYIKPWVDSASKKTCKNYMSFHSLWALSPIPIAIMIFSTNTIFLSLLSLFTNNTMYCRNACVSCSTNHHLQPQLHTLMKMFCFYLIANVFSSVPSFSISSLRISLNQSPIWFSLSENIFSVIRGWHVHCS